MLCEISKPCPAIVELQLHWMSRPIFTCRLVPASSVSSYFVATGSPIQPSVTAWIHAAVSRPGDTSPSSWDQSDRLLAILKGQPSAPSAARTDLSALFVERAHHDPAVSHSIRSSLYESFFAAFACGLCGGTPEGWSKIPIGGHTNWLASAIRAFERIADELARRWIASRSLPTLQELFTAIKITPPDLSLRSSLTPFRGVCLALRDVASDLCIIAHGMDSACLIDIADIEGVVDSPYWSDTGWMDIFVERRIRLHTASAAQGLVERIGSSLDGGVTEFTDRGLTCAKLALFASDNGLGSVARTELKRAMGCILGYGWHKDMFAFEVLESIDMLIRHGSADARKWLLDLAAEFEEITAYTDGDETRVAREEYYEAIANHYPSYVPHLYGRLIQSEEWGYAERVAVAFAKTSSVECRTGRLLVSTYLSSTELNGLLEPEHANRPGVVGATSTVVRRTGRVSKASTGRPRREPPGREPQESSNGPPPSDYPPGTLDAYIRDSSSPDSYGDKGEQVAAWLQHWDSVGRGQDALNEFATASKEAQHDTHFRHAFLLAFAISLRTQGRSAAFSWLTRSFVASLGWARWFSDQDRAHATMREVATHYPRRWQEFIRSTASPAYSSRITDNGIAVGLSTLVRYLLEVGQPDIAQACGLVMVSTFKEELSQQPIKPPAWSQ